MRKSIQTFPAKIVQRIFFIRLQKVMFDFDLAEMFGVETRVLKQAVRRNKDHFPKDFMFILNMTEVKNMVSQNVIPSRKFLGGAKPMAFTEQGVSMLSSVFNSPTAIEVNIQIIRIFTKMKEMLLTHKDILLKMQKVETKLTGHDEDIKLIFEYLKKLLNPPQLPRKRIGFKPDD